MASAAPSRSASSTPGRCRARPATRASRSRTLYGFAVAEGRRYRDGGLDGLIVENHGDIPFAKPDDLGPETAACMAVMAERVRREVGLPVGINVLANGALPALAVAKASGAAFVRVNQWANAYVANEGLIEGPAAKAARYRAWLHAQGRADLRRRARQARRPRHRRRPLASPS